MRRLVALLAAVTAAAILGIGSSLAAIPVYVQNPLNWQCSTVAACVRATEYNLGITRQEGRHLRSGTGAITIALPRRGAFEVVPRTGDTITGLIEHGGAHYHPLRRSRMHRPLHRRFARMPVHHSTSRTTTVVTVPARAPSLTNGGPSGIAAPGTLAASGGATAASSQIEAALKRQQAELDALKAQESGSATKIASLVTANDSLKARIARLESAPAFERAAAPVLSSGFAVMIAGEPLPAWALWMALAVLLLLAALAGLGAYAIVTAPRKRQLRRARLPNALGATRPFVVTDARTLVGDHVVASMHPACLPEEYSGPPPAVRFVVTEIAPPHMRRHEHGSGSRYVQGVFGHPEWDLRPNGDAYSDNQAQEIGFIDQDGSFVPGLATATRDIASASRAEGGHADARTGRIRNFLNERHVLPLKADKRVPVFDTAHIRRETRVLARAA